MAFVKASVLFLLIVSTIFGESMAAVHQVGDSNGWNAFGTDYKKWAATKNFQVGDSLVFNYNPQFHNVLQVSAQDYATCTSSAPISSFNSGSDSILLPASGNYYFICSFPGNCQAGQKVTMKVPSNPSTPGSNTPPTGGGQNFPGYDPTMTNSVTSCLSSGKLGLLIIMGSLLLSFHLAIAVEQWKSTQKAIIPDGKLPSITCHNYEIVIYWMQNTDFYIIRVEDAYFQEAIAWYAFTVICCQFWEI